MASRKRKVIIFGAKGFERTTTDLRIECFQWYQLAQIRNVRDYDVVIFNLLPLTSIDEREKVAWNRFRTLLDFRVTIDILMNGGSIYIVGDPRFNTPLVDRPQNQKNNLNVAQQQGAPFLEWTGVKYIWDSNAGDTITRLFDYRSEHFSEYIAKFSKWRYSLFRAELDYETMGRYFKQSAHGEFKLSRDDFCRNRYKCALAFTLHLSYGDNEFGPLVFLPELSVSEEETIQLMLSCIGIETDLPEPKWLSEYMAPGQDEVDDEISRIETELSALNKNLEIANFERASCRECLKLLYEKEHALEPVVRDILRALGADVEDPKEKGKEDGWLAVKVGDKTYEGVLEVKSTRRDKFGEDGRKQLLEWIDRGRIQRHKNYKGVFIGNSAVEKPVGERPDAFSDNWRKAAELSGICALKTEHLYAFYVLKKSGKIEMDEIWKIIFESNGVLNFDKYLAHLNI
ncbi:MAG: hypothetical protein OXH06_18895 [Gemmatimonadetes bacterium]|nr:hypothetical protein [Gemmatimonadota bacterium]